MVATSSSIAVLLAVVLAACFLGSDGALTQAQRDAVLKAHNDFRALKGLSALTYNLDAEDFAEEYVNTGGCPSGHSGSGTYGENLYWSSGTTTTTLVPAVNAWHSEEPYWSCQNNDCKSGEMCGHYTQVMWNNTQSVGCGLRTTCTGSFDTMISCNYYPRGNDANQRPFTLTKCPSYPYFKNDKFVLTLTLNTTASSYSAAKFKTAIKDALKLADTDRVYIMGTSPAGSAKMQTIFRRSAAAPFASHARPTRLTRVSVRAVAEAEPIVRKAGPLQRGGTLSGEAAAGKDAGDKAKQAIEGPKAGGSYLQIVEGKFRDDRWISGRWDLSQFAARDGTTDWDKVIDAEIARRKLLEDSPIPSTNEEPVLFDTAEIPWWAWVRRFHLPEAEKLNGRAAMMGYVLALFIDKLTGASLLDQQNSFLGLLALHITVFGILLIRSSSDLDKYKNLLDEATFYDRQWSASWDGVTRPSEKQ